MDWVISVPWEQSFPDRWNVFDRFTIGEYRCLISTVWLVVPHPGGTYESYLQVQHPLSLKKPESVRESSEVITRYETRVEALLGHTKLNLWAYETFSAVPEVLRPEELYALFSQANRAVHSGIKYNMLSLCCNALVTTDVGIDKYDAHNFGWDEVPRARGGYCSTCAAECQLARLVFDEW